MFNYLFQFVFLAVQSDSLLFVKINLQTLHVNLPTHRAELVKRSFLHNSQLRTITKYTNIIVKVIVGITDDFLAFDLGFLTTRALEKASYIKLKNPELKVKTPDDDI